MKRVLAVVVLVLAGSAALVVALESGGAASSVALNPNHECSFCHGLHGAGPDRLLKDTTFEAVCLSCHGPGGIATVVEVHTNDPTGTSCCAPFRVTCKECHDPHSNQVNRLGGENLKLVLAEVVAPRSGTARQVIFESRGKDVGEPTLYSFCDDDEDNNGIWDQVCDVCHEDPDLGRHHWDGTKSHHQKGATCTRCHKHENALNP